METQVSIVAELQDFFRRRAEVELDYSKNLDKLWKTLQLRQKEQKQKWVRQIHDDDEAEAFSSHYFIRRCSCPLFFSLIFLVLFKVLGKVKIEKQITRNFVSFIDFRSTSSYFYLSRYLITLGLSR